MHHALAILKILIVVKLLILAAAAIVLFRPFMRNWRQRGPLGD
jgi:flagellar basal body-associated protein FliL